MCVIIKATHSRPGRDILEDSAAKNGDGAGIAWFDDVDGEPMVHWQKGLGVDEIAQLVEVLPMPFVVHFRKTSAGVTSPFLCHPFPINERANDDVEGHAKRVLFHNGTISKWKDTLKTFIAGHAPEAIMDGPLNDTRAAAYMAYHAADGENYLPILSDSDRFLVMDAETQSIREWGDWYYCIKRDSEDEVAVPHYNDDGELWEAGLIFSNSYWKKSGKSYTNYTTNPVT